MFRALLVFVLFWVIARLFWRFVDGVVRGATAAGPDATRRGDVQAGVKMLPCPVCGTYVVPGKAITQSSGSGPIYFCSEACRAGFVPR